MNIPILLNSAFFFRSIVALHSFSTVNIWTKSSVGIGIEWKCKKKILYKLEIIFISGLKFYTICPFVPNNKILLHFSVSNNQILLRFSVTNNQILLNLGLSDNCTSGPDIARRIYSLSSCWGHQNEVKFGCWGCRNWVKFGCRGHWNYAKFGCWGPPNGVKLQSSKILN